LSAGRRAEVFVIADLTKNQGQGGLGQKNFKVRLVMGFWKEVFSDYFDDRSEEISRNGGDDSDVYDDRHEVNDPHNPIWQDSEIHPDSYGVDPTLPDPNEVNQD
jgi:hypothetical protein